MAVAVRVNLVEPILVEEVVEVLFVDETVLVDVDEFDQVFQLGERTLLEHLRVEVVG